MASDPSSAPYRVVARRFRPRSFDEVVGQEAVLTQLRSALTSDKIPHALLFSGSRGVGKTTMARIMARALNCEKGVGPEPCGECHMCTTILAGKNPDVLEIDAASHNLVDDIRELRERVSFASMGARYKVYILDEVHMLTRNAFNAFLKTLEEPPPNVVFVLATTEVHKVPETIRSRCQPLVFRRIDDGDIATRLRAIVDHEKLTIEDAVLEEISSSVRGGMRDAETALERILPIASEAGAAGFDVEAYRKLVHRVGVDRVADVVAALATGDAAAGLHFVAAVAESGVDEREALGEVVDVLRAILLLGIDGPETGLIPHSGTVRDRLATLAAELPRDRVDAMIQAGLHGRERIRRLDDRRLVLELALLRMAEAGTIPTLAELATAAASGAGIAPPAAAAGGRTMPGGGTTGRGSATAAGRAPGSAPRGGPPNQAPSVQAGSPQPPLGFGARLATLIQERKPMLAATLAACEVEGPSDSGVVRMVLQTKRKMHIDRLRSPEVLALLQELIDEAAGKKTKLEIQTDGATPPVPPASPDAQPAEEPQAKPKGSTSRAAERIKDKFDGQFLDSE